MSLFHSPNIVKSGLVLYLDAANPKSLPSENLLQYSEGFNISPWGNSNCVLSPGATSGPYGDAAYSVITTVTVPTLFYQSISTSVVGTGRLASSVYAKTNTSTQFTFNSYYTGDTEINSTFTLTGSGSTNDPTNSYIESVGEGWYRCTIITPERVNAGTAFNWRIWPQVRAGATGIGCYFWGAQLRKVSASDKYIKTESSVVNYGSIINDLSGNGNNGTIYGDFTFNGNTKVLHSNGVTGSYIDIPSPNLTSSNFTVISAIRYAGASPRGRIVSGKSNNWILGHWNSQAEKYYAAGWVTSSSGGPNDELWRIYAGTGNISLDQYSFWSNKNKLVTNSSGGSAGPNGFSIGRYGFGNNEYSNCDVSFLLAYNRILSDQEIEQTFNALRSRYEI